MNNNYKLKPKEVFEIQDYSEQAGMISIYTCSGCGMIVIYSYIASGITPCKITCVKCGNLAWATEAENIKQPDRIWYRPENIYELERLAIAAYECGVKEGLYVNENSEIIIDTILKDYVDHYNSGGLFARLLKKDI